MGWLFSDQWLSRKDLGDHLINGNVVKTLKYCWVGCNLYCVHEYTARDGTLTRFACVYLTRGKKGFEYGYKDMDETMHPYYYDFPVSWLDMLSSTDNSNANEWRECVRKRAAKLARMKVGTTWERACGERYTIIERRSPSSLRVKDQFGDTWRTTPKMLLNAEEVTQ